MSSLKLNRIKIQKFFWFEEKIKSVDKRDSTAFVQHIFADQIDINKAFKVDGRRTYSE
jgi:hypothetical protein